MPTIGEMNKRVKFFPKNRISNGAGGWKVIPGEPITIWAKVRHLTPREVIKYQAKEQEIDSIIEARYTDALADLTKGSTAELTERGRTRKFEIDNATDEKLEYKFLKIEAREVF